MRVVMDRSGGVGRTSRRWCWSSRFPFMGGSGVPEEPRCPFVHVRCTRTVYATHTVYVRQTVTERRCPFRRCGEISMAVQTNRKAEPRRPWTRAQLVRAAIDLADQGGIESLSMRKLSQHLGGAPMSLYNHVS